MIQIYGGLAVRFGRCNESVFIKLNNDCRIVQKEKCSKVRTLRIAQTCVAQSENQPTFALEHEVESGLLHVGVGIVFIRSNGGIIGMSVFYNIGQVKPRAGHFVL